MSFRLSILFINRKILDTAQFLQTLRFVLHASILLARSPTANWILKCKPRPWDRDSVFVKKIRDMSFVMFNH